MIPPLTAGVTSRMEAHHIQFVGAAAGGARTLREFHHPRHAVAIDTPLPSDAVERRLSDMSEDDLLVLFEDGGPERVDPRRHGERRLASSAAGGTASITLSRKKGRIEWRPGFVLVRCEAQNREDILAALVDFAFYDKELRRLEGMIEAGQLQAESDAESTRRLRSVDRAARARLGDSFARFSRARLAFARLEPELGYPSRKLTPAARVWVRLLLRKAGIEARLEVLNDQLEALEEFYEAANQRITDYRWYREGHLLEISILLILILECLLMAGDIYIRSRDQRSSPHAARIDAAPGGDASATT